MLNNALQKVRNLVKDVDQSHQHSSACGHGAPPASTAPKVHAQSLQKASADLKHVCGGSCDHTPQQTKLANEVPQKTQSQTQAQLPSRLLNLPAAQTSQHFVKQAAQQLNHVCSGSCQHSTPQLQNQKQVLPQSPSKSLFQEMKPSVLVAQPQNQVVSKQVPPSSNQQVLAKSGGLFQANPITAQSQASTFVRPQSNAAPLASAVNQRMTQTMPLLSLTSAPRSAALAPLKADQALAALKNLQGLVQVKQQVPSAKPQQTQMLIADLKAPVTQGQAAAKAVPTNVSQSAGLANAVVGRGQNGAIPAKASGSVLSSVLHHNGVAVPVKNLAATLTQAMLRGMNTVFGVSKTTAPLLGDIPEEMLLGQVVAPVPVWSFKEKSRKKRISRQNSTDSLAEESDDYYDIMLNSVQTTRERLYS